MINLELTSSSENRTDNPDDALDHEMGRLMLVFWKKYSASLY